MCCPGAADAIAVQGADVICYNAGTVSAHDAACAIAVPMRTQLITTRARFPFMIAGAVVVPAADAIDSAVFVAIAARTFVALVAAVGVLELFGGPPRATGVSDTPDHLHSCVY